MKTRIATEGCECCTDLVSHRIVNTRDNEMDDSQTQAITGMPPLTDYKPQEENNLKTILSGTCHQDVLGNDSSSELPTYNVVAAVSRDIKC